MDNDSYRDLLRAHLTQCAVADVTTQIPTGSGVFHIANVAPDKFNPAWVSTRPGRFSGDGEAVKYYANDFEVCARELGYPPGTDPSGVVFVSARMTAETIVFDIHKLPPALQAPLFDDKSVTSKWEKSYVLMKAVREDPRFTDVKGTYYPSASGQMLQSGGSCLALFDQPIPTTVVGSGDYSWFKAQYGSA